MRTQHYHFAHGFLRAFALGDPARALASFRDPIQAPSLLRQLWDQAGKESDPAARRPPDGLAFRLETLAGGATAVLFLLPPPKNVAEAWMTALVIRPGDEPVADRSGYFTLEHSESLDGKPITMLCRWTNDGMHLNFGAGPKPEAAAFLAAIADRK